jgi:hypothetical protein
MWRRFSVMASRIARRRRSAAQRKKNVVACNAAYIIGVSVRRNRQRNIYEMSWRKLLL